MSITSSYLKDAAVPPGVRSVSDTMRWPARPVTVTGCSNRPEA